MRPQPRLRRCAIAKCFRSTGRVCFARSPTGPPLRQFNGDNPDILHSDALLVGPQGVQYLEAARSSANSGSNSPFQYSVDLPVNASRIGVAESGRLLQAVDAINARIEAAHPDGDPQRGRLESKLVTLLAQAATGRHQTRLIIPTLAVQLALVVLVVLGLVLAVGVDQRRPELALARLRGQSRRAAARLYLGEVAAIVAGALLPGLLLSWLGCALLCAWWLPDGVRPELRLPVLAAAVAVAITELALAVVLTRRAAAQPISALLRSVPARRSGRAIPALEVALAVAALAGVLVALSGDRTSVVSLLAPSLIAIVAGLLLSRLLLVLARQAGRRALWRGQLGLAMAALQAARRPGFRRVVTLVCVAVALLVSSVDQWRVSAINRQARAQVTVGAAVVLDVNTPTAAKLRAAVDQADPAGSYAMPVVVQRPAGGDTPVVALDHRRLRRIAGWGSARDTPSQALLDQLVPANPPAPIRLAGTELQLRVGQVSLTSDDPGVPGRPQPVSLWFQVQLPDGSLTTATLPVASGPGPSVSTGLLGGCAAGCTLSRIELVRGVGDFSSARVSIELLGLAAGRPGALLSVPLGAASDWANSEAAAAAAGTAASISFGPAAGGGLRLAAVSHGTGATLQHLDVPVNLACLLAGGQPAASDPTGTDAGGGTGSAGLPGAAISMHGIDGESASCQPVGTIALLPRLGTGALLTDLDLAISSTQPVLTNSSASVWLNADDPVRERRLTGVLAAAGISISGRSTVADQQRTYDQSPPAWSIRAALASAVLAAAIAALMVVIAAFAAEPARSYDLAALRLIGLSRSAIRRGVLIEQLAAVGFAVLVGAIVGTLGARLALPAVPLFVNPAPVPKPLYGLLGAPLTAVLIAVAAVLVLLVCTAFIGAFVIGRRVSPDRLREGPR